MISVIFYDMVSELQWLDARNRTAGGRIVTLPGLVGADVLTLLYV